VRQYQNRGIQRFAAYLLAGGALLVGLPPFVGACASDDPARACRIGVDCASGVCGADGQCVAQGENDGGTDGGPSGDSAIPTDAPITETGGDSALPGCTPNKDGTITRAEVPIAAGLHATYKIGSGNVITAGTAGAGGKLGWDYTAALADDVSVLVETQSLVGKWFEAKFAGATYATKLSNGSDILGVFETSPGALLLRGLVSPTETASPKTDYAYGPAVSVLKFPLTMGATWTTDSTATGTAAGIPLSLAAATTEKYDSKVDAVGELKTPLGTFDVLRVATVLTRKVGFTGFETTTVIRSFAFVTECYGTVATITSANNEANAEFTNATEIRRISP